LLSDGDERLAPLYFATAVVVATSRVYVRIHHASDVVGGMAVGRALGLIGKRLAPLGDRDLAIVRRRRAPHRRRRRTTRPSSP